MDSLLTAASFPPPPYGIEMYFTRTTPDDVYYSTNNPAKGVFLDALVARLDAVVAVSGLWTTIVADLQSVYGTVYAHDRHTFELDPVDPDQDRVDVVYTDGGAEVTVSVYSTGAVQVTPSGPSATQLAALGVAMTQP